MPQLKALIEKYQSTPGGLMPLLHAIQDEWGHVPAQVVGPIAQALNLSRAEVHGVITYYHHFRSEPAGRQVIQICRAESCQACGSEALVRMAEKALGCTMGQTSADGSVTLEPVYCLGLCASSPAIQVNEQLHARVTSEGLERILSKLEVAA
jgi:formate dehydrogenase subunit gamma